MDPSVAAYDRLRKPNIRSLTAPLPLYKPGTTEQCQLLTSRKDQYYIHEYQPARILDSLMDNFSDNPNFPNLLQEIDRIFDMQPRTNCCNCIALGLYFLDNTLMSSLMYLSSIKKTIQNVKVCLPDYLVRLYIDPSVYTKLTSGQAGYVLRELDEDEDSTHWCEQLETQLQEVLDFIFDSDNVEVYTYFCPSLLSGAIPLPRTRTLRFLPLIDPTVNICHIREADGTVTYLDCHNIRLFENSFVIFYFSPLAYANNTHEIKDKPTIRTQAYNKWLRFYMDGDPGTRAYFTNHNNLIDILAGTVGLQLMVRPEVFEAANRELRDWIDGSTFSDYALKILNIGYDEILLLHLFRTLVSVKIANPVSPIAHEMRDITYDMEDYELIRSLYWGERDMFTITIDFSEEYKETVLTSLVEAGIIYHGTYCQDPRMLDLKYNYDYYGKAYYIDSWLLPENIAYTEPFNIIIEFTDRFSKSKEIPVLNLINVPYTQQGEYPREKSHKTPDCFDLIYETRCFI